MKPILHGACALLFTACAMPAAAADLPKWLTDAMAREVKLPPVVAVTGDDGWFQARVPGAVNRTVSREDGSYSLAMQLEGGVTMSCEVLPGPRDLAAFLSETAEISFREIAKVNGVIQSRAVDASDAGAAGPHAFLALRWMYRALNRGEQRVGALQQFVADMGAATLYCAHDELGYHQTFHAVARAVISELRVLGEQAPEAHFREISVISLNGNKVGVASTTMVRDADGDTKVQHKTSILAQRTPGELYTQDGMDVEWVRPDGSLINASQVKSTGGQQTEDMALKAMEEGRWRASGKLAGKDVQAELPSAPDSFITQSRARQQMLARDAAVGSSVQGRIWSSLDLTRLLPTRSTVLAAAGEDAYAVREELGSVTLEAVLDRKTGTMRSAKMPMGPLTLHFDRVLQQGSF